MTTAPAPLSSSPATPPAGPSPARFRRRLVLAGTLVTAAVLTAVLLPVRSGSAAVVTRFGAPVRVVTDPGLAFKLPAPVERAITVDLRLRTTASGLHAVLTKDGISITVQAWVAWKVRGEGPAIQRFLQAVQNRPEEAASQLRTLLGSSLETVAGRFALADLLTTQAEDLRLAEFEAAISTRLGEQTGEAYGIAIEQVGIERLMLPDTTVEATITRMKAERETVAEEKRANGRRIAAEIRSNAEKDARIAKAKASEEASVIESEARRTAAGIYGEAHQADPQLYAFLRSLDTLDQVVGPGTRLVLRTDAAPFRALVEAPGQTPAGSLSSHAAH